MRKRKAPAAGRVTEIVVYAAGTPAGSKRHVGAGRIVDANPKARDWLWQIANVAGEQWAGRPLLHGALELTVRFERLRPKSHYGTGRNAGQVRASAPPFPTTAPDATKLVRAVEDALTGVIWRDDAQIVMQHVFKSYGDAVRCSILIAEIDVPLAPA